MTVKEKIAAFKEKYGSAIRADYMPSVDMGGLIINPQYRNSNDYIPTVFYKKIFVPYVLYDKNLDVMAVAIGTISTKKTGGEQRQWEGEVYYIVDHEQKLLDENGETPYCFRGEKTYRYAKYFLREFGSDNGVANNQLKLFLGENIKIGNRIWETKLWCLAQWFVRTKAKNAADKMAKLGTVSNTTIDTGDVDGLSTLWAPVTKTSIETNARYDIIKCFENQKETQRIYFDSKTKNIYIFYCVNGTWERGTGVNKYTAYIINKNVVDKCFKNTKKLKYLKEIITNNMETYKYSFWDANSLQYVSEETDYIRLYVPDLIKILKYPILEKLYKAGYMNIYNMINKTCAKAELQRMFGIYDSKSKTIHGALGLNKFQLDFIERESGAANEYRKYISTRVLSYIKSGLNIVNISDIDNTQFQSIYTFVKHIIDVAQRWCNNGDSFWKEAETFAHNITKLTTMANRVNKISKQMPRIYNIYNDMVNMYGRCKVNHLDVVDIDFDELKDYQDFVRYHDYYTNVYNTYQVGQRRNYDQATRERYEKLTKQYEKLYKEKKTIYEYTSGDYIFKIPEDPERELAYEGRILGHCVDGYSDLVLLGKTNIIFLREKLTPTIPFMTIEVNNGKVVQCHGSHNAWLGSCERYQRAIPTVMNWLHEKNIKCSKDILTSKAMGYSSCGAGNIELPQASFDIKEILI